MTNNEGYSSIANAELYHHGIKGQRWGIRRFQDESGQLTEAGKKRYGDMTRSEKKAIRKSVHADMRASRRSEKERLENTYEFKSRRKEAERMEKYEKFKNSFKSEDDDTRDETPFSDELNRKIDADISEKAQKKAYKDAVSKYGKETVDAIQYDDEKRADIIAGSVIVAGLIGLGAIYLHENP